MADAKTFPIETVLGLTTGILLKAKGFGELHELAEHVAGHAIFTHEFADEQLWRRLVARVFAQHPQLRGAESFVLAAGAEADDCLADYVRRVVVAFGVTLEIAPGSGARAESPLQSLQRIAPGKPVIVVAIAKNGKG
jgi:hypothetical protein